MLPERFNNNTKGVTRAAGCCGPILSSLPAPARAASFSERLEAAARDPGIKPEDIRVVPTALGEEIFAGQTRIMRVLPAVNSICACRIDLAVA